MCALSTVLSNELTTVLRQGSESGTRREVSAPEIIADYNQFMGGVDLADQFICYYSVGRKNMKWWRKVVWRLHDHAICNAHVIYKANNSTSLSKSFTNYQFRLKLIEALTEPLLEVGRGSGHTPVTTDKRLVGKHFLHHSAVRKRCAVCSARKVTPEGKICKDKKIKTWCPKCQTHLCIGNCFQLYHTRTYYGQK